MDTIIGDQSSSSAANPELTAELNKSAENNPSEDKSKAKAETSKEAVDNKDRSKFKNIESRYKQSTQDWVNRRSETSNQVNRSRGQDSRNSSRNPTPERRVKKASTPRTNEKSLNVSGISAINKIDDKLLLPEPDKYRKPLMGRKSLAPKKLAFAGESYKASASRAAPMIVGIDATKKKDINASIQNSIFLQSMFLKVKSEQALKNRRQDAKNKISRIWNQTNKIREEIIQVSDNVQHLEDMLKAVDILEEEKSRANEYLKIREESDALFHTLAELIGDQKRLIRLKNCSEEDFKAISCLMATDVAFEGLQTTDKASRNLENAEKLWSEINVLEKQLEECFDSFGKCVAELDKYYRIESKLNDKNLSLRKLF